MIGPCSRRRVLRVGGVSALSLALAGCSEQSQDTSCKLHHEVWEVEDTPRYDSEYLDYGDLSDRGKRFFDAALESGSHVTEYDGTNAPADFSYSDEAKSYVVEYEESQYTLLTYTAEGCTIE